MIATQILEDRISSLERALTNLLTALDAQDEDPRAYVAVDSARAAAVETLERGRVRKPQMLPFSDLIAEGYRPRAPSYECMINDSEAIADQECKVCNERELSYVPFTKNGEYRAFAECLSCGHAVEF